MYNVKNIVDNIKNSLIHEKYDSNYSRKYRRFKHKRDITRLINDLTL